jgi:hypothetical protein
MRDADSIAWLTRLHGRHDCHTFLISERIVFFGGIVAKMASAHLTKQKTGN